MKTFPISALHELLEYYPETGLLFWKERGKDWFKTERDWKIWNTRYAGKRAFTAEQGRGYLGGVILGKKYFAHRVCFAYSSGFFPLEVDHLNHNRSDNRRINLRAATTKINGKNQSLSQINTSGTTGVYWLKTNNKWRAKIRINDKQIHLGCFINKQDAIAARKQAEDEYGFHANHGKTIQNSCPVAV